MASIKHRIKKAVFELNNLFAELLQEVVKSTKTLTDLPYGYQQQQSSHHTSQSTHLQQQVESQRDTILRLTNELIQKDREIQILLVECKPCFFIQQQQQQLLLCSGFM